MKITPQKTLLICFLVLVVFQPIYSVRFTGSWNRKNKNWDFFARFCFQKSDKEKGNITWVFDVEQDLSLNFYDDQSNWDTIYHPDTKCSEIVKQATISESITSHKQKSYLFPNLQKYSMWYFTLSDCKNTKIQVENMHVHIWNPFKSKLSQEFSCEHQGLLALFCVYFVFFLLLTTFQSVISYRLKKLDNFHPIIRIYLYVLILRTFGIFCVMCHFGSFAQNGKGSYGLEVFGQLISTISIILFMTLLILVAKGWTISVQYILGKYVIITIMSIFLIFGIILIASAYVVLDKGSHYYALEAVPGVLYQIMRLIIMGVFLYYLRKTYLLEQISEKRNFYKKFGIVFTIWFLYFPLLVLISLGIPGIYREKVTQTFYLTFDFFTFIGMTWLLWPSTSIKFFKLVPPSLTSGESTHLKPTDGWAGLVEDDSSSSEESEEETEESNTGSTNSSEKSENSN
ncbi:intimal thickness receptor-related [Anaeramoeba flamelloides]|uniref:Intimal thickness receptor-related n=1 Tax=Anaeramoeba flamelloides TaxID=1746091 RepID=A0AAV8A867_9EUKA|nr:intimal thickness receptor-related [Anaeramoeba flamelloides]